MARKRGWIALLVMLPVGLAPVACGESRDERAALEQEELSRELDLALRGDTATPTFADTATAAEEEPAPQPAPRNEAPRRPPQAQPRPQPQPSQPAPPRSEPAPQPQPRTETLAVPTGTTFAVQLDETIATDRNMPGDPFPRRWRTPSWARTARC